MLFLMPYSVCCIAICYFCVKLFLQLCVVWRHFRSCKLFWKKSIPIQSFWKGCAAGEWNCPRANQIIKLSLKLLLSGLLEHFLKTLIWKVIAGWNESRLISSVCVGLLRPDDFRLAATVNVALGLIKAWMKNVCVFSNLVTDSQLDLELDFEWAILAHRYALI